MHPELPASFWRNCFVVCLWLAFVSGGYLHAQKPPASAELATSRHTGVPITFELWSWGEDEAGRKKLRDLRDGDRVPLEGLPEVVQFRFRIAADHNGVTFKGRSADGEHRLGWSEDKLTGKPGEAAAERIYRAQPDGYFPQPCRYALDVQGRKDGAVVGEAVINVEFVKAPPKPIVRAPVYANAVGNKTPLPAAKQSGAAIQYELWQWEKQDGVKKLADLKDGAKLAVETLPSSVQFQFRVQADFDAITCRWRSTDSSPESVWPQKNLPAGSSGKPFRSSNLGFFPQIGRYALEVRAERAGRVVADGCIQIELVSNRPVPANTSYLAGKKDWKGNAITTSTPVVLGPLNETPVLRDNDYAFAPQKAYSVINWERFPPFRLNARFPLVWASRRFTDEAQFGGPLNRGFTTLANIHPEQDNLRISERSWFHYPGQILGMIDTLLKKDPEQYADLRGWKEWRSAFIAPDHAALLGKMCYEGWGVAGWGPYDPGIYGWDEEEMFAPSATRVIKEHPEQMPEKLVQKYRDKILGNDAGAKAALERDYDAAMAEFVGDTYRGAREAAAQRGRTLKIWHYGSRAPGKELFMFVGGLQGVEINPKTGKYRYEEIDALHEWFRKGRSIDFDATSYAREIDYFHTDFYFHVNFPQSASLYEKDAKGYVLDEKGRRILRRDLITEDVYAKPTTIGLEDWKWGPIFLRSFIAKEENNQFWFNGGKYYQTPGTQITDKQMPPYIRPGTQETFGEIARQGSRPVNPYLAEATTILTFLTGAEALFVWDEPRPSTPVGQTTNDKTEIFGDLEFAVKGLHRVSQFNTLFDGTYSFIRPVRHYNTHDRDQPIIRGLVNGRYLLLALLNPALDPGEQQEVEIWYDSPYATRGAGKWKGQATIQARRTHLFQCKLPALPAGQSYDPSKLYFRYRLEDGKYTATFTVTGNYDVKYPYAE